MTTPTHRSSSAPDEPTTTAAPCVPGFDVNLPDFSGPFDVLLALISRQQRDITTVALSAVTDDFLAFMEAHPQLSHASEFVVVAATLLALKTHRLLPHDDDEDDPDIAALLEERDLLFGRLLQYQAYRQAAEALARAAHDTGTRWPHPGSPHPHVRRAPVAPSQVYRREHLAAYAADVLSRRPEVATRSLTLHERVSTEESAARMLSAIAAHGRVRLSDLWDEDASEAVIVAMFLAALMLFHSGTISIEQDSPLGDLLVSAAHGPSTTAHEHTPDHS